MAYCNTAEWSALQGSIGRPPVEQVWPGQGCGSVQASLSLKAPPSRALPPSDLQRDRDWEGKREREDEAEVRRSGKVILTSADTRSVLVCVCVGREGVGVVVVRVVDGLGNGESDCAILNPLALC